ncbi:MAG TPA: DUF4286 family protein [Ignavibacteria bacterium]|nr:DUF4286 family protein [Ignavibacteria bacterium]
MIIYNVTLNIDKSIIDEWLEYMIYTHIPDVMKTGMFTDHKLLKLLHPEPDEGVTYAIQYFCKTQQELEEYQKNFAPALQNEHIEKFGEKVFAFRTVLETVE